MSIFSCQGLSAATERPSKALTDRTQTIMVHRTSDSPANEIFWPIRIKMLAKILNFSLKKFLALLAYVLNNVRDVMTFYCFSPVLSEGNKGEQSNSLITA